MAYKMVTIYENGSRLEGPLTNCTRSPRDTYLIAISVPLDAVVLVRGRLLDLFSDAVI